MTTLPSASSPDTAHRDGEDDFMVDAPRTETPAKRRPRATGNVCSAGFKLPKWGAPCPECGATEDDLCRRYCHVFAEQGRGE